MMSKSDMKHPFSGATLEKRSNIEHLRMILTACESAVDFGVGDECIPEIVFNYLNQVGFFRLNELVNSEFTPVSIGDVMSWYDAKNKNLESYVYVMECSDGSVKIGKSNNPDKRCKSVASIAGKKITNTYFHKLESTKESHKVESMCHRYFSDHLIAGEWFLITFEDAKERVMSYAETVTFARIESK